MRAGRPVVALLLLFLVGAEPASASDAHASTDLAAIPYPVPPCAGSPSPDYPELGQPPVIRIWRDGAIRGWRPAECTGFGPLESNSVIATAGRFRLAGGMDALAEKVAQISALTSIRYYSVREKEWQPLFLAAYRIDEQQSDPVPRPDFTGADIQTGRLLRYWLEENSLLKPAVYQLSVRERTSERLSYTIVNESDVRALFLRAIAPGEFRQFYIIEREASDVWRYYSLVDGRTRTGPFKLSDRSYINRAGAYYRYMAGIPTDMEPPPHALTRR